MKPKSPNFSRDLRSNAYSAAAALVTAEAVGGGGWSLIWKVEAPEPINERAAAKIYTETVSQFQGLVKIATIMGEALSLNACIRFPGLVSMANGWQVTDPDTGKRVDLPTLEQAAKTVMFSWRQIENYARAHMEQWEEPDNLPLYRIDLIEPNDNPPAHHRAALVPGAMTPCSLFQSPGEAFAIRDELRARTH